MKATVIAAWALETAYLGYYGSLRIRGIRAHRSGEES